MEPKLHRRVQRYGWDLAVQDYDRYFVPLLRHCSERCLEMAELQPGERVLDVPLDRVAVTVEADYDARGMFGVDDSVAPGWGAVRYTAVISSPAPEERVRELVETADRHSPILDDLRRALPVSGEHRIAAGKQA